MKWLYLVLFLVPFGLAFHPDLPNHGYGQMWWFVPILYWIRQPERRKRLALYALGIVLQTLAFPEPDLGVLGWALLLPYLFARKLDDGAVWWRAAFAFGFFRGHMGYYWLGGIHFSAWIAVAFLSGLGFAFLFELGLRRLRFVPFALRVAICWAAFEWYHSWMLGGFPWLFLSHTQYAYGPVLQVVDLVGAAGLSFVMAYAQGAVAARKRTELIAAGALVAAVLGYGLWRTGPADAADGPAIVMVQTKQPHSVKETVRLSPRHFWRRLMELTREGLKEWPDARLVVWPETIYPWPYVETGDVDPRFRLSHARSFARQIGKPMLIGLNSYTNIDRGRAGRGHNSAVLIEPNGGEPTIYRKQHLVPMGEEFLLRYVLPEAWASAMFDWLAENVAYPRNCDLEKGDGFAVLDAGEGLRCVPLICFEGLYPDMGRAALSADADLVIHLVNNGWFGASWEQRQSVACWVMRAVETRTPFFSCANGGVTCAIAPDGRILGRIDRVMEEGVMGARVPRRWDEPWFMRGGAYAVLAVSLAGVALFGLLTWRRRTENG
ncbi:MAG: apolipoprotein N-acyltransferase [Planctomycetota bacterium]|nr:apolipoprotein N-acyltransferase [Planctomycetota bacterium]